MQGQRGQTSVDESLTAGLVGVFLSVENAASEMTYIVSSGALNSTHSA